MLPVYLAATSWPINDCSSCDIIGRPAKEVISSSLSLATAFTFIKSSRNLIKSLGSLDTGPKAPVVGLTSLTASAHNFIAILLLSKTCPKNVGAWPVNCLACSSNFSNSANSLYLC